MNEPCVHNWVPLEQKWTDDHGHMSTRVDEICTRCWQSRGHAVLPAQEQFAALPEWAQTLIRGLVSARGYGLCRCNSQPLENGSTDTAFVNSPNVADVLIGLKGAVRFAEELQKATDKQEHL